MKTPEPKFLLKDPKAVEGTLISLFVRYNKQRVVYTTGEKIAPNDWDFVKQRPKNTKKNLAAGELTFWLDKIETEVKSIFRNYKINGIIPDPTAFKEELSRRLGDTPVPKKLGLFEFIEKYISDSKAIKRRFTINCYNTTLKHLRDYARLKKSNLDFEDIDLVFYSDFVLYLTKTAGHSQNTVAGNIKVLKVFLNAATEAGVNTNLTFRNKKFKRPVEEITKIYLNTMELDQIYALDLTDHPNLDRVRDLFIIGCYTGLRFSDFSELKSENIEGGKIKIKTRKTNEVIILPLSTQVRAIYEKYNNTFPKAISNQKMNKYLKEVVGRAGVCEPVVVSKLINGEKRDQVFKKYELVSTHCARRSFATNAYAAGIPALNIMKLTGHKTEKIFQNYIRFTKEENANQLQGHIFFNQAISI